MKISAHDALAVIGAAMLCAGVYRLAGIDVVLIVLGAVALLLAAVGAARAQG